MINCHSMLRNINLFLLYQSRNRRVLKWGFFMNEYRVQWLHLGVFLEIGKNYLETLSYLYKLKNQHFTLINILKKLKLCIHFETTFVSGTLYVLKNWFSDSKEIILLWRLDSSISPFSFLCSFSLGCQMVSASVFHNKYC